MTAGAELIFGDDRVCSEAARLDVAQV